MSILKKEETTASSCIVVVDGTLIIKPDLKRRRNQRCKNVELSNGDCGGGDDGENSNKSSIWTDRCSEGNAHLDVFGDNKLLLLLEHDKKSVNKEPVNETQFSRTKHEKLVLAELLTSERNYVQDLDLCCKTYYYEYSRKVLKINASINCNISPQALFGNLQEILSFHRDVFLKDLEASCDNDSSSCATSKIGTCFLTWASAFENLYINYCKLKTQSNAALLVPEVQSLFAKIQAQCLVPHPIGAYLIKPVQRITKYQLLLKELLSCSTKNERSFVEESSKLMKDALNLMLTVPQKANDALHLDMLNGCDILTDRLGKLMIQETFQVSMFWKKRTTNTQHRVFMFEQALVFAKERITHVRYETVKQPVVVESTSNSPDHCKSSSKSCCCCLGECTHCISSDVSRRKIEYVGKFMILNSELGLTEHVDENELQFVLWTLGAFGGLKIILECQTLSVKQQWIEHLRKGIQYSSSVN